MNKLTINSLTKRFKKYPVLIDISFHIETGEIIGIFGRNERSRPMSDAD
jgi:ABC-type uncharacterized transport system ATPase subunit